MMRNTAAIAVFAVLAGCAGRTRVAGVVAPASAISAQLIGLEREIGDANIRRDKAFFERVEADDFIFIDGNGGLTTKREDVGSLDTPSSTKLLTYEVDSTRVQVYGETAVVSGRIVTAGTRADGSPFRTQSRFSDVFVRRQGSWQLVFGHSSRIPPPKSP